MSANSTKALSAWYAGYHDLVRGGQYVFVVEEMHRKYGALRRGFNGQGFAC